MQVRQVETVTVTDQQMDARTLCDINHPGALVESDSHRLLDHDVLAGRGCCHDIIDMNLVRGRRVDGVDAGIRTQVLEPGIGAPPEVANELLARFGARVGGRNDLDARMPAERRQHQHESASEPGHAQPERACVSPRSVVVRHSDTVSSGVCARDTQTMISCSRSESDSTKSR